MTSLKKWLRKEDVYDTEFDAVLTSQGINDPETDFKTYTQAQFDDFYNRCVVQRAKDIKDQKAKVRLQKKISKVEKYWRKQSGIKSTSIKKGGKKKKKTKDDSNDNNNSSNSSVMRKFLQKEQCFISDLLEALISREIYSPEDFEKIDSNKEYDLIFTEVRVARAKDLKSNAARMRMEKSMTKFEKIWRKSTGIKITSVKKSNKNKSKQSKSPKTAKNDEMSSGKGKELKLWMRKVNIFEIALFEKLLSVEVYSYEDLNKLDESQFDNVVREVRVDRFSQLNDQKSRNRVDKLLVLFEKQWRAATGIKKTSIKK